MWHALLSFLHRIYSFPYWGEVLTSLKFLGLFVSSVAGFAAALPEPKNKKAAKLAQRSWFGSKVRKVLSKDWTLRWVVIGLGVALISQFVETIKTADEAKKTKEKEQADKRDTDTILSKLQTNSLDLKKQLETSIAEQRELQIQSHQMAKQIAYMDHMAGEFNTLTANITCELISTNPAALLLIERAAGLSQFNKMVEGSLSISPIIGDKANRFLGYFQMPPLDSFIPASNKPRRRDQKEQGSAVYSQNYSGYINMTIDSTNRYDITNAFIAALTKGGTGEAIPQEQLFESDWFGNVSSDPAFTKLMDFIQLPMLGIRIFSHTTTNLIASDADFYAPPKSFGAIQPTIGYDPLLQGVLLNWSIEYPNREWRQTVRMGSVHDLDGATLCFYLANTPDFLIKDFKPLHLTLKFGKTRLTTEKVDLQSYEYVEANHIRPSYYTKAGRGYNRVSGQVADYSYIVAGDPKVTYITNLLTDRIF